MKTEFPLVQTGIHLIPVWKPLGMGFKIRAARQRQPHRDTILAALASSFGFAFALCHPIGNAELTCPSA